MEPIFKWSGGKRWLAPRLVDIIGELEYRTYFEPFMGSGSVFFQLEPESATLSDSNPELINAYQVLRDQPEQLHDRLLQLKISSVEYYRIRSSRPTISIERAVRFCYLNRTSFNGLYRVNKHGDFNVPFGCKENTRHISLETLVKGSNILQDKILRVSDFDCSIAEVGSNDLIYLDPPYSAANTEVGTFVRYNNRLFGMDDQIRLAKRIQDLAANGVHIMMSNVASPEVASLYPRNEFIVFRLNHHSSMAASSKFRGLRSELLIFTRGIGRTRRQIRHSLRDYLL